VVGTPGPNDLGILAKITELRPFSHVHARLAQATLSDFATGSSPMTFTPIALDFLV
jgi:hypothetical protein